MNYTHEQIIDSRYGYSPNIPANLFGLVTFGLLVFIQTGQGLYYKQWWFTTTWFIGLVLQTIGYGVRFGSIFSLTNFSYYCIQLTVLTISPGFLMAGIYHQLAKVVTVYGQEFSYLRPKTYTRVFIACDIFSIVVQASGGGVAASSPDSGPAQTGEKLMIAGLATQLASMLVFFGLFCVVAYKIYNASPTKYALEWYDIRQRPTFWWFIPSLLAATLLILIRSIYRVIQLAHGWDSDIAKTERYQLICDGLLVLLACIIMTAVHPGMCLGREHVPIDGPRNGKSSDFMDDDEVAKYYEKRNTKTYQSRCKSIRS